MVYFSTAETELLIANFTFTFIRKKRHFPAVTLNFHLDLQLDLHRVKLN